ncbi:hypothetical protein J7E62_29165 [Variovorax paradoxus]|nr:hypothetical protein [Variovorax paradoxus]
MRSQLLELQTALNQRGFASGVPDGMMDQATREGLRPLLRLGLDAGRSVKGIPIVRARRH